MIVLKGKVKLLAVLLIMLLAIGLLAGCGTTEEQATPAEPAGSIILATTTSTQDSGLLDYLLPEFTKDTGIEVQTVAVGTGAAIQMGVDGEADVLLVHSKADEEEFMANGDGVERSDVMYNDFILVGPTSDPAGIKAAYASDIVGALKAINDAKAKFVSRGDDSGTHKKELKLWKAAAITPEGDWYISAGQGMGPVLTMASEQQAYTISDRATYLSMKDTLDLEIVCEGSADLLNQYGVITVNPEKNDQINYEGAKAFYDWMISDKGQELIGKYGVEEYGQALFTPNANK